MFPSEAEIRNACKTMRARGYTIHPGYTKLNQKKLSPLMAVASVRVGIDNVHAISLAISHTENLVDECYAFYYGFDNMGKPYCCREQYELGQKLRRDWERGQL